jgi:hypothetical protein
LAKYEPFYKGGSGYTFQVNVDDFNKIVEYITTLEQQFEPYCYEVFIEGEKSWFDNIDDVIDKLKSDTFFEVDGESLRTDIKCLGLKERIKLDAEDVYVKRI